jgi:hypothetical protein
MLWSVFYFTSGSTTYLNPFLFLQEEYSCPSSVENCSQYVCSLPQARRQEFIDDSFSSLADKFGDYRCDSKVEIEGMQTFIYMGGFVGVMLGTYANEYISKRRLLIATVLCNIFGVFLSIFGNSLFLASIGLFINNGAKVVQMEIVPCMITETVS